MYKLILFLCGIGLFYSCGSSEKKVSANTEEKHTEETAVLPSRPPRADFPTGKIIPVVKIKADSSQSYALYLPADYKKESDMPALFLFEPHAKGTVPLSKYKALADRFHFIMMCSNTSQNGMSEEVLNTVIENYMQDAKAKLAIDLQRIYVGGFSGGSVVAGMVAVNKGGVKGVIGAGKGLPQVKTQIPAPFNYFGIVGDGDFNYDEMLALDKSFEKSPIKHQLVIFEGKHEWPPIDKMEDALFWMDLMAMKEKQLPVNNDEINAFIKIHEHEASVMAMAGRNYEAAASLFELIQSLNGLHDISTWQSKLNEITKKPEYLSEVKLLDQLNADEMKERGKYIDAFKNKPSGWWSTEIQHLKTAAAGTKGPVSAYNRRMLSLISMVSFIQADAAIKNNMIKDGSHFLEIFKMVDPQNSDLPYLNACVMALQGNKTAAFAMLNQAVAMGFNDKNKLINDPAWKNCKTEPAYQTLLAKIQ